jgi:hypothetical protein
MLAENKWAPLFESLAAQLSESSELATPLMLQQSKYAKTYEDEMLGLMGAADAQVEYTRLVKALDILIRRIEPGDLRASGGAAADGPAGPSGLHALLAKLEFKQPITPLYLLNCDRKASERKFNQAFRNWEQQRLPTQFYFSLGCPTQRPGAFAERIVFEVVAKKEGAHANGLYFPRTETGRLQIAPLEMGITLADTQAKFKEYVARHLQAGPGDFERFLQHELPARREAYLFLPFWIEAGDWDPDVTAEYLQWLMDTFPARPPKGPVCIFLLVIRLRDAYRPERIRYEREVFDQVMALAEQNAKASALIHPLPPVPRYYLEEWFGKVCSNPTYEINALIDAFCQGLSPEERSQYEGSGEDRLLNMERIIELQALVGDRANQQTIPL